MLTSEVIEKPPAVGVRPNLVDYDEARRTFRWSDARRELDGLPDGGLNIAHEAVDRHARGPRADHVALRYIDKDGTRIDRTYAELADATGRVAAVLEGLGVQRGEVVFTLTPRVPELYATVLGTLKAGMVLSPLFAAFGPDPIAQRIALGDGRVLVTTASLYRRRIAPMLDRLTSLSHVLVIGEPDQIDEGPTVEGGPELVDLRRLVAATEPIEGARPTSPEDPALLHFTSGTTGTPKGALHVHEAVLAHYVTSRFALDLHPDDVFWCTADPGWVTGTSYGIIAPLVHGATNVVDGGDLDPDRWYGILGDEAVTVWYTAPTAIRMLMRSGAEVVAEHDLSALRFVASVGEPLNPEAVRWGVEAIGLPIHDNWWQSETGGIMVANFAATAIRPGSMGRPLPGIDAAIIPLDPEGEPLTDEHGDVVVVEHGPAQGELALRRGWPSMFRAYLGMEERYQRCFVGDWYRSGDVVERDADGYLWFVSRNDDVIKTAGHLIGPFEVESALVEHPAVAEAGVIGLPDEVAGNIIKAFVSLNPGIEPTEELRRELLGHARKKLGPAVAPRIIDFADRLPTTRSGKIMRRLLRARELGLPEGDLSTLERPANDESRTEEA